MSTILKAAIIFLVLGVIFFNSSFSSASLSLKDQFKSAFAMPVLLFKNMMLSANLVDSLTRVNLENQSLRANITRLSLGLKPYDKNYIVAKIYSSYPFNDKSLIVLSKGSTNGVKVGDVVLANRNIFLGRVTSIGDSWSEVRTIFDLSKNIPVRIGTRGVPALLVGGATPFISMIDKSSEIRIQDPVYLASRDLPYGLVVGEIGDISEPNVGSFKNANLLLPYSLSSLEEALIVK